MVGSDESAEDALLEKVQRQLHGPPLASTKPKHGGSIAVEGKQDAPQQSDNDPEEEEEDSLALLLKKLQRWCGRLTSSLDEHMSTQKRVLRYCTGILHSVTANFEENEAEVHDGCLLDVDSSLLFLFDDLTCPREPLRRWEDLRHRPPTD